MLTSTTQIAREIGCSQQTVSRILNGKAHLHRPELVERVRKIAQSNHYRANHLANGLLRGRTRTVGVVVPMRDDVFYTRVVTGIHNYLASANVLPLLSLATDDLSGKEQILRLVERRVDGIIIRPMFSELDEDYLADVLREKIPVVTVNRPAASALRFDHVASDDAEGGRIAARHFIEFGHQRAAFIAPEEALSDESSPIRQRLEGFSSVFGALPGNSLEVARVPSGQFASSQAGKAPALDLLNRPPAERPTALFLAFDQLAWGVYAAARELDLGIPGDLSVIGFSNQPFARYADPPLTTISQHPEKIGHAAADLLHQRIEGNPDIGEASDHYLKPTLNSRKSCGPAPV